MTPMQEAIKRELLKRYPNTTVKGVPTEESFKVRLPIEEVSDSQIAICEFMIKMERAAEKKECFPDQNMHNVSKEDFLGAFSDPTDIPNGFHTKGVGDSDWGYDWKPFF